MNFKRFAELMMKHDLEVLFVGIVDDQCNVLATEMRKGSHLYSSPEHIHAFIELAPTIVMGALERMKPALGAVTAVVVRYEKRVLLFSRCEDLVVVLGFDPTVATPLAEKVGLILRRVAKESEEQQTKPLI